MTALLLPAVVMPVHAEAASDWRPYIARASLRFGVPSEWVERVIGAESDGHTMLDGRPIRSRAGAIGLMQLMPSTWETMRRALGLGTNPDDPADNITAGTYYLRLLYDRFGYPALFAAYNAGPERYADHLATGSPLPLETIAYLRKMGAAPPRSLSQPAAARETLFAIPTSVSGSTSVDTPAPPLTSLFAVTHEGP